MASINAVLRKKPNAQGLYPITIRITKNRKSSYVFTGQYVDEKYWDITKQRVKKSHPNSVRVNNFILKKLSEANDNLLDLEGDNKSATAQRITKKIKSGRKTYSFFDLSKQHLIQLEAKGKHGQLSADKARVKHFKRFLKHKDITFPEITEMLLKQFQGYLKKELGQSDRTIINNLIVIRTLFNLAIRQGIVDRQYYPFGKGGITIRFPQTVKIGLTKEELNRFEIFKIDHPIQQHARRIWLFSFYFAGMRISDVLRLKWSDLRDDRLFYQMGKNQKTLSLKVPEKALIILEKYEDEKTSDSDFIFPELKKANTTDEKDIYRKIKTATKRINKYLKQIAIDMNLNKPLTMHIARHSFGHIAGGRIPVQVLQLLYRHSDITTTINYQNNFAHDQVDDALDKVINL